MIEGVVGWFVVALASATIIVALAFVLSKLDRWHNIGGGCRLGYDRPIYPCSDQYENNDTGERVTIYSTEGRHFDMPLSVDDPLELYLLNGVMTK